MSDIIELNGNNFEETINADKPVLVDFYAVWCGPCRKMMPIIEELATEYKDTVIVAKIDGSEYANLSAEQNVTGVPTLILYKEGKEVGRLNGIKSKGAIIKLIGC
jgi:thioredoxin 1